MRTLIRWVGVTVVTSAAVGGAAAMMYLPAASSASTTASTVTPNPRDVVTPEISSLVQQAEQLNSQIGVAQSELARLKNQVNNEAAATYYRPQVMPTVSVGVGATSGRVTAHAISRVVPATTTTIKLPRPTAHATTGASSTKTHESDDGAQSGSTATSYSDN